MRTAKRAQLANTRVVQQSYERWQAADRTADDRSLVLSLGWSKGLSTSFSKAQGIVSLDLTRGSVSVDVSGAGDELGDFWLVDNRPGVGNSVMPEIGDEMRFVGTLQQHQDGTARLAARLDDLDGFEVDLVVVTRPGGRPERDGILFGVPTLFQRLALGYSDLQSLTPARAGDVSASAATILSQLVDMGEDLFLNETFEGNGRTCGTCHPPQNNFTIDPKFIASLSDDDPLFVAEFIPALAENFENPVLMRKFGLIVENVDGLDDLANKFTMRSVPHTFAQGVSITPSVIDGSTQPPFERTGWSGDGAPGGGTLREFPIGAVTQHAPLTLSRTAGVDFRLPTDLELDAMEAFQLSLGRQQDFDLSAITFHDPRAASGVELFNGDGKCSQCHLNAGANIIVGGIAQNANFNTGVEDVAHPADATGELRPRDGGFGQAANPNGGFGDGNFNTTSVIEAADTPPFFHNNLVNTIEEAVAFYNSPEFNNSPSGIFLGGIDLKKNEILDIAAFLRVINSVDNIDRAIESLERVRGGQPVADPSLVCINDIEDTLGVLFPRRLHPEAAKKLFGAAELCFKVIDALENSGGTDDLDALIDDAIDLLEAAQADMATF